jgi:FkbM family methyltransferase
VQIDGFIQAAGFRPNTIVHVGASVAQELRSYEALRPRQIVWVEANPSIARRLRWRIRLRRSSAVKHVCIQALVTDKDGQGVVFNIFNNDSLSSSIFKAAGALRREWPDVRETGKTKTLVSSRLDTILLNRSIEPDDVDALVVDLQGAELLCLKGAGAYLAHVSFIEVEVSTEAIYDGGVLFPELDSFLSAAGFVRVSAVPWHGDVVYVRTAVLGLPGFERLHPGRPTWRQGTAGR